MILPEVPDQADASKSSQVWRRPRGRRTEASSCECSGEATADAEAGLPAGSSLELIHEDIEDVQQALGTVAGQEGALERLR
jgi:hypothetical protein